MDKPKRNVSRISISGTLAALVLLPVYGGMALVTFFAEMLVYGLLIATLWTIGITLFIGQISVTLNNISPADIVATREFVMMFFRLMGAAFIAGGFYAVWSLIKNDPFAIKFFHIGLELAEKLIQRRATQTEPYEFDRLNACDVALDREGTDYLLNQIEMIEGERA